MMTNETINLEAFANTVKERVAEFLSDEVKDSKVSVSHNTKNNGNVVTTLMIQPEGKNFAPCIHLEGFYEMFKKGNSLESVLEKIAKCAKEAVTNVPFGNSKGGVDATLFYDYEGFVKAHLGVGLININTNSEKLKTIPYRNVFGDLALTYYIMLTDGDMHSSVEVRNDFLSMWGITSDKLHEDAIKMAKEKAGQVVHLFPVPAFVPGSAEDFPMRILRSESDKYGAAAIAYSHEAIRDYAVSNHSSLYLVPSSIYEWIITPAACYDLAQEISKMVKQINATEVAPTEVLSDHAYYYDMNSDEVFWVTDDGHFVLPEDVAV